MSTAADEIARALPGYDLGAEVGRGQYGRVWQARHRQLHRDVAIKQLLDVTEEQSARFRREARILAALNHPHVVVVHDYVEADELRLLVMELLDGGTLADRMATGISMETALATALAAAAGLHHVHERGVLHRDVKPENLMFDTSGTLKLTDFGVASDAPLDATAIGLTQANALVGTPAYVSPEQAGRMLGEGWPEATAAADQYSLGAVLYQALSGRLTHDAAGGVVGLCTRRMNQEAIALASVAPFIDPHVAAVVMRAVSRDPAARHPSCEAFGVDLATAATRALGVGWLDRSDVAVRAVGPIRDAATQAPSPSPAAPPGAPTAAPAPATVAVAVTPSTSAPRRKGRPLLVAAIALLALATIGVGALLVRQMDQPDQAASRSTAASGDVELTKAWAFPTGGPVFSSPAAADGIVVVGSDDGKVYGLDPASGARRWEHATDRPVKSSPTITGGRAYVGSNDGNLYSLDAATGEQLWETALGYELASSPTVDGDTVFVGGRSLHAIDAATGEQRWAFEPTDPIVSSPAVANGVVVVGSNDREVYGIEASDGSVRWHVRTGDAVQASPTVAEGTAFIGSLDGYLYAIDVATGDTTWAVDVGAPIRSSAAVAGDQVIVGTSAGNLVSFARDDGSERWSVRTADSVDSSPLVVGDVIVVGSNDGKVHAVTTSGTSVGTYETGGPVASSPARAGALVVVGSDDGKVYALEGLPPS